jgi:hypothetical protein
MTRLTWLLGFGLGACAATTPPAAVSPTSGAATTPIAAVSVPVPPPAPSAEPPPLSPAPAPEAPVAEAAIATETSVAAETPENLGLATLRQYYADLNSRAFEASKYFAPDVKQYITMQKPTPKAIDQYLREVFPKQYESYEFLFDESTVQPDGARALKYVERWRAYVVRKREFQMTVSEVRVEFDLTGKIVDFRYGKVLSREVTPELH